MIFWRKSGGFCLDSSLLSSLTAQVSLTLGWSVGANRADFAGTGLECLSSYGQRRTDKPAIQPLTLGQHDQSGGLHHQPHPLLSVMQHQQQQPNQQAWRGSQGTEWALLSSRGTTYVDDRRSDWIRSFQAPPLPITTFGMDSWIRPRAQPRHHLQRNIPNLLIDDRKGKIIENINLKYLSNPASLMGNPVM